MALDRFLIGDTIKLSWINSGVTPTVISGTIISGSETIVSSVTMSSSGNGHYYSLHTLPDSAGYYIAQTLATVDTYPYKRRIKFAAVLEDVD